MRIVLFVLCFISTGVMAHGSGNTQMSAQEMQISAVERWSRMVTHDQRQRSAKNLHQNAEKTRQRSHYNADGTPKGYKSDGFTGEGVSE